jgi:uncharacterized protein YqfB (UPF0267 family)
VKHVLGVSLFIRQNSESHFDRNDVKRTGPFTFQEWKMECECVVKQILNKDERNKSFGKTSKQVSINDEKV